jgi:hypothetical protein
MVDGIKFSNGMAYNANPSGSARFPFDPSPGGEADPQCISLDDLLSKVPKSVNSVYVVNSTRGCFDLSTRDKELTLSDDITVARIKGGAVDARVVLATSVEWPRYEGLSPYHGHYFIVVDFDGSEFGTIHVLSDSQWPTLTDPVVIGSFFSDANGEERGVIQGLSVSNDDVTVDGVYIYNNGIVPDRQAVLVGSEKNALKLDTSDHTFSVDAEMYLTLWQPSPFWSKVHTVPVSSGTWNKGNQAYYDGQYYIIVEVFDASLHIDPIIHVRVDYGTFSPGGTTYLIGSFIYDSTKGITGITYPGDLMIDGVSIWGGSGGTVTDVPNDGLIYGRSDDNWSRTVRYSDINQLVRLVYSLTSEVSGTVAEITATGDWTVPAGCTKLDAFLVGGGGAGGTYVGGGGGGGYTSLAVDIPVTPGELLYVNIGAGGVPVSGAPGKGGDGVATRLFRGSTVLVQANGGEGGYSGDDSTNPSRGGNGGSGGGAGAGGSATIGGDGGSDGNGGQDSVHGIGGAGHYTTRCPFNNTLYAGGGGGTRSSFGGAGGGGGGGAAGGSGFAGAANTGGGGGGNWDHTRGSGGAGGSGIVILRYRS